MPRDATPADFPAILQLNAESVHFLSPLDAARLAHLHAEAAYHRVVERDERVVAFLLVFREGADYDSPNYRWFAARYERFLYIDRVVVDVGERGRGHGAELYEDLFRFATEQGVTSITCEFDLEPPNPVSLAFHERYGFVEVGTQRLSGGKLVSLRERRLHSTS